MKVILLVILGAILGTLAGAWWGMNSQKSATVAEVMEVNDRYDGGCIIEQESADGLRWVEVVLVFGFLEDYKWAEEIVEGLEKAPGSPRRYRIRLIGS
jgi:hypothetical protein